MRGHKLLYGASGLMVLGFCTHVLVDYLQYDPIANSAPFRLWIYVDAALWLIPAVIAAIAGFVAKKKLSKKEKIK